MKKIFVIVLLFGFNLVYANENVKFYACVDGDTFKIQDNGSVKVIRMLSIDTPESVKANSEIEYYGKEASEYTCNMLKNAKIIELEYDEKSDMTDRYDRMLAWVYVDNELLQEKLVENGYARVAYVYDKYKYVDLLKERQEEAKKLNIGIWDSASKSEYDNNISLDDNLDTYENIEVLIIFGFFLVFIFIVKLCNVFIK